MEKAGPGDARPPHSGITEVILDPYINAIHVTLLHEKQLNPAYAEALVRLGVGQPRVRVLGETLLSQGVEALEPSEILTVLSDADIMSWLHREAWMRPANTLADWCQTALRKYEY